MDDALLAQAGLRFQKVARIVGHVMRSFSQELSGIPDSYYAQRVAKLVKAGLLESRGDLRRMRFSEVRRPGPSLSAVELERLIAEGKYTHLGQLYEDGQGVPQDYVKALEWYRKGAEQGDIWAQFSVGRFYEWGNGVHQDDQEACFWYSLAASRSSDKVPFAERRDEALARLIEEQREEVRKRLQLWNPHLR